MKSYCLYHRRVHEDVSWQLKAGDKGWICSKGFTSTRVPKGITTRSMRPDGTIAVGLEGIRLRDRKLKAQQKYTAA